MHPYSPRTDTAFHSPLLLQFPRDTRIRYPPLFTVPSCCPRLSRLLVCARVSCHPRAVWRVFWEGRCSDLVVCDDGARQSVGLEALGTVYSARRVHCYTPPRPLPRSTREYPAARRCRLVHCRTCCPLIRSEIIGAFDRPISLIDDQMVILQCCPRLYAPPSPRRDSAIRSSPTISSLPPCLAWILHRIVPFVEQRTTLSRSFSLPSYPSLH
ncbi:hypothetical protein B0H21DRAFT_129274 [Amylocystis lapponica]|nr:hypothetical protein B0H21DRAFT_129274 [Amylocystis lapponica]